MQACAQGLVEVGVVSDEALQCLIKANEGRYNVREGNTISMQDLHSTKNIIRLLKIIS